MASPAASHASTYVNRWYTVLWSTAARTHLLVPRPLACCVCFVACRVTTVWRLKHDLNEE